MSGYAKRAYNKYICDQKSFFYKIIKDKIIPILPAKYNWTMAYNLLKEYYPLELRAFQFQLDIYKHQDKTLEKIKHKRRYNVRKIENYLNKYPISNLFRPAYIQAHGRNFEEVKRKELKRRFIECRQKQISKRMDKINAAKLKAQNVEPNFLDKIMGIYTRKGRTQKDRVYIIHELYKYDCAKVTNFLSKLLVSEQNFQIREMVFKHLQDYGYLPKLRRKDSIPIHTKNKSKRQAIKEYRNLQFSIEGIPDELSYLINNSSFQKLKNYDYFISHSFRDYKAVQNLIKKLNAQNYNIYCDWISDSDYLKRELVCEATLEIIEKRISESNAVLFVDSKFSRSSKWVIHELQYAKENNKPIKMIDVIDCSKTSLNIKDMTEEWFVYKEVGSLF